jgi:hypothetical protein
MWRRRLFVWEETLHNELLVKLNIAFSGTEDTWVWGPENGRLFTVKSTYSLLASVAAEGMRFSLDKESVFQLIWQPSRGNCVWIKSLCVAPCSRGLCSYR